MSSSWSIRHGCVTFLNDRVPGRVDVMEVRFRADHLQYAPAHLGHAARRDDRGRRDDRRWVHHMAGVTIGERSVIKGNTGGSCDRATIMPPSTSRRFSGRIWESYLDSRGIPKANTSIIRAILSLMSLHRCLGYYKVERKYSVNPIPLPVQAAVGGSVQAARSAALADQGRNRSRSAGVFPPFPAQASR